MKTTSKTLEKDIKEGLVFLKFWATWCGPCKLVGPIFDEVEKENENVKFLEFELNDDEDSTNVVEKYGVTSVPTIIILKDGKVVDTIHGIFNKATLESEIKKYA